MWAILRASRLPEKGGSSLGKKPAIAFCHEALGP
jgi:hypothetical protein